MTLGLTLAFMGYLLAYSAVRNVHPWCPILEAFGKSCPPVPGGASITAADAAAGIAGGQVTNPGGPVNSAGLTPRAAAFLAAVTKKFPDASYLGGSVCRTIKPHDGGSSDVWSEHAWGNATDFGGPAALQAKIVAWSVLTKVRYGINNIIPAGSAINAVHVDFLPSHAGTVPPCAGGK